MSQPEPRERSSSRSRRAMSLPCLSTRAKSEGSYEGALLPDIVLYETAGWISHPRVAPDGKTVAFIDHPTRGDDAGAVAIVEPGKPARHPARRGRRLRPLRGRTMGPHPHPRRAAGHA